MTVGQPHPGAAGSRRPDADPACRSNEAYEGAGHPVLETFSLTVEPAEAVAVIGPSGDGNSPLLNLIAAGASPQGLGFATTGALLNHGAQTTSKVSPTGRVVAISARTRGSAFATADVSRLEAVVVPRRVATRHVPVVVQPGKG